MNLVEILEQSGLTGRGGAAFSTAVKIEAAQQHGAALIVNACDGEIGAAKDGHVVEHHLDELRYGASLVAGERVTYAAHRGSATSARLRAAGLPVLQAPPRYVSSEETALIALAHGGLARPMTRTAPFVRGGRDSNGRRVAPTVVLNAETLLRVAQVAQRGPAWFRSLGTDTEPGPRLVSVGGDVLRPVVVPAAAGMPLASIIDAAGGCSGPPGAVLLNGLGGGWLTASEAARTLWSTQALSPYGLSTGPAVVTVLGARTCPLEHADVLVRYAAGESAGQCGPCMFGLPALADDLHALVAGRDPSRLHGIRGRLDLLPGRGACHFPDGVARFVASTLDTFGAHVQEHLRDGCPLERSITHELVH